MEKAKDDTNTTTMVTGSGLSVLRKKQTEDMGARRQERAHLLDGMGGRERATGWAGQGSVGKPKEEFKSS